ncbi:MAG: hypothetical protein WCC69_02735 [Pirellulales bacterium]
MENLALLEDVTNEPVAHSQALSDRRRRTHDDVKRKPRSNAASNPCRLFGSSALVSHHDEQIDIGILPGRARGMGSKQHNAIWAELADNLADILLDMTR